MVSGPTTLALQHKNKQKPIYKWIRLSANKTFLTKTGATVVYLPSSMVFDLSLYQNSLKGLLKTQFLFQQVWGPAENVYF